ncbi:ABC transporter ATP-binding protein [Pseudoalteromonas sp. MTN2-4]|uniref:ABC transporter ATP-binding protein n=1 Tax=Pseudoalteromonas sp. MTN2-4 TaxID=3056555 RepID=UPI0036F1F10A
MSSVIKVTNLSKSFESKAALKDVSFEIEQGKTTALIGPNGAGKTTLFSILCGYLEPDSGQVDILGHQLGDPRLFSKLSALPQDAQLDPRFSLEKQLCFYSRLQGLSKPAAMKETHRVLELVGLKDNVNSRVSELSHGMRKRVCIAQALIDKPEIILLDEATAGLDPVNAREIRNIISDLSDQATFILSSHDLSELERLCSHILYLEQGELSEHKTHNYEGEHNYLTLQLTNEPHQALDYLKQLQDVTHVQQTQSKEFVIEYKAGNKQFDVHLLKYCHKLNWQYRQLINGNTLENELFNKE